MTRLPMRIYYIGDTWCHGDPALNRVDRGRNVH